MATKKTPPPKRSAPPTPVDDQKRAKKGRRLRVTADLAHGGSLSVRHMADGDRTYHLDTVSVTCADEDGKHVWIQLAKTGDFAGHPAGPFSLNASVFGEIVANFRATQNRKIPIDFEHASEADATSGSIPTDGAPAQGWIRDLKIDGGNLWGLVEWGTKARDMIRAGGYQFISPAIRFGARDRVTGKSIGARLTSAGLTNQPFLDGMRPLAAKDAAGAAPIAVTLKSGLAHGAHEYMPTIKAALGMHELCSARECGDQLERLRDHFDAVDGDAGATHEGVNLSNYMHPLRDAVGAAPGATWDEVFDVVGDLIEAAIGEHVIEDHGGDAGGGASMNDAGEPQAGDTTMAVDEKTVLALSEATANVTKLTTEKASMSLKLDEAHATIASQLEELRTLRDKQSKSDEAIIAARIEEAFDTHKDKKGLTDSSKKSMAIVLRADPKQFEEDYPRVKANERHLLRSLTEVRVAGAEAGAPTNETFGQTVKRIEKERKLSYADAQNEAIRLRAG